MPILDDPETIGLLHLAHGGHADAWAALVRQHAPRLRRLAGLRLDRRLVGRLDPDDVVQEALLDVHRSLGGYLGQPEAVSFGYWIRQRLLDRIGRIHRDHLSAQIRCALRERDDRPAAGGPRPGWLEGLVDTATSASHRLTRDESARLLREALERLDEVDREILTMFFFEGWGHGEIGVVLELSPGSVKSRQYRAVHRLASALRRTQTDWCHDAYPRSQRTA